MSCYVLQLTWRFLFFLAMTALTGISSIMTARPANTEGPSSTHRKYRHTIIWKGADHSMFKYVVNSINLWASTDIRFTISPTVDVFQAVLLNFNDCNNIINNSDSWDTRQTRINQIVSNKLLLLQPGTSLGQSGFAFIPHSCVPHTCMNPF